VPRNHCGDDRDLIGNQGSHETSICAQKTTTNPPCFFAESVSFRMYRETLYKTFMPRNDKWHLEGFVLGRSAKLPSTRNHTTTLYCSIYSEHPGSMIAHDVAFRTKWFTLESAWGSKWKVPVHRTFKKSSANMLSSTFPSQYYDPAVQTASIIAQTSSKCRVNVQ